MNIREIMKSPGLECVTSQRESEPVLLLDSWGGGQAGAVGRA